MKVGISGGTGLVGRRLIEALLAKNHQVRVFSRRKIPPQELQSLSIEFIPRAVPENQDWEGLEVFVNLAGENLAGVYWTKATKEKIYNSRVQHTYQIIQSIQESRKSHASKLHTFLQASAVGYYGFYEDNPGIFDENSPLGEGFLAKLCQDWEAAAHSVEKERIRLAIVRIGIVLDPRGGALSKLVPAYLACVGGPIGKGTQGMSWIHYEDLVRIFLYLMENPQLSGVWNGVAPHPVSNEYFSRTLGEVLHRPSFLRTPPWGLQLIFGEGAQVLTYGQFVYPKKLMDLGFSFSFPELKPALQNLLDAKDSQ